jgi:carbamoyl-phosphate synthase large subunit
MNILLTCVGRRNYLVEFFRRALRGRGQVYGADADPYAAALHECDRSFVVHRVDDPEYCGQVLALCREHEARLIIPLIDLELPIMARQRDRFLAIGTIPVISSPDVVDMCFDKWATRGFLMECGLSQPRTYVSVDEAREAIRQGEVGFPLVVKPRWGSASLGIEYPEDDEELEMTYHLLRKRLPRTSVASVSMTDAERSVLIQERLCGQEYGLDIVNDLDGRYVTTFVRRKFVMRGGETDQAITVASEELVALGATIGRALGHVGNLDCDVLMSDERCDILELNPRFGGGYPFSHIAGANLPAMLIAWASGEPPDASWLTTEPDVSAVKCDRLVVTTVPRQVPVPVP